MGTFFHRGFRVSGRLLGSALSGLGLLVVLQSKVTRYGISLRFPDMGESKAAAWRIVPLSGPSGYLVMGWC